MWSFFFSVFSRIRTEHGNLQSKSSYSVQLWEITTQKNSVFRFYLWTEHGNLQSKSSYSFLIWEITAKTKLRIWAFLTQCIYCYSLEVEIQMIPNILHFFTILSEKAISPDFMGTPLFLIVSQDFFHNISDWSSNKSEQTKNFRKNWFCQLLAFMN